MTASPLSAAEHEAVTSPGLYWRGDFGWLYPAGLGEPWWHELPPGVGQVDTGWLARRVAAEMLTWGAAEHLSGTLVSSCSKAFDVALAALTEPGDRVVIAPRSFDVWTAKIAAAGRKPRYAWRDSAGLTPASVARLLYQGATAVVACQPDNPLGTVMPAARLAGIAGICASYGAALICDHALVTCQPHGVAVPTLPPLAPEGLRYACLLDTGKLVHLDHAKFGLAAVPPWQDPARVRDMALLDAASWQQGNLARVHHVITHRDFDHGYLSRQVAANWNVLARRRASGVAVRRGGAGSGVLVSVPGMRSRDLAGELRRRGVLVIPLPRSRWCRVALGRPREAVEDLAAVLAETARS